MALESGTYISDLVSSNPGSTDTVAQGDDHIRLIKALLLATFPNITGAVTGTHTQLNAILAAAENTVKGFDTTGGVTKDIDMTTLKNMLGLASAAFTASTDYATSTHNHNSVYAAITHTHAASDITSGTMAVARLPAATTSAKGIVEAATTAEMTAGTADKYPDAEKVKAYVDSISTTPTTVICTITGGGEVTASHSYGATPKVFTAKLKCITSDTYHAADDRVFLPGVYVNSGTMGGISVHVDDTLIYVRAMTTVALPSGAGGFYTLDLSKWVVEVDILA